jgi:hypothetical protein
VEKPRFAKKAAMAKRFKVPGSYRLKIDVERHWHPLSVATPDTSNLNPHKSSLKKHLRPLNPIISFEQRWRNQFNHLFLLASTIILCEPGLPGHMIGFGTHEPVFPTLNPQHRNFAIIQPVFTSIDSIPNSITRTFLVAWA